MIPKIAYLQYAGAKTLAPKAFVDFLEWVNTQIRKIAEQLKGPVVFDMGSEATSKTIVIARAHLTQLTLTGNAALTMSLAAVAAEHGYLELIQDATGGRVPTWINASGNAGAVTAPSATASKKTLYLAVYNGSTWILSVLASGY